MNYREALSKQRITTNEKTVYAFTFATDTKGSVYIQDGLHNLKYKANFFIFNDYVEPISNRKQVALIINVYASEFIQPNGATKPELIFDLNDFLLLLTREIENPENQ